jgi:hypothetical protein
MKLKPTVTVDIRKLLHGTEYCVIVNGIAASHPGASGFDCRWGVL